MKKTLTILSLVLIALNGYSQRPLRGTSLNVTEYIKLGDSTVTFMYGDTLPNKFYVDSLSSAGSFNRDSIAAYNTDSLIMSQSDTINYADTALAISAGAIIGAPGGPGDVIINAGGFLGNSDSLIAGSEFTWDGDDFFFDNVSGNTYLQVDLDDTPFFNYFGSSVSGNDHQIYMQQGEFNLFSDNATNSDWVFEVEDRTGSGRLYYSQDDNVNENRAVLEINTEAERNFDFYIQEDNLGVGSKDWFSLDTNEFTVGFDNVGIFTVDASGVSFDNSTVVNQTVEDTLFVGDGETKIYQPGGSNKSFVIQRGDPSAGGLMMRMYKYGDYADPGPYVNFSGKDITGTKTFHNTLRYDALSLGITDAGNDKGFNISGDSSSITHLVNYPTSLSSFTRLEEDTFSIGFGITAPTYTPNYIFTEASAIFSAGLYPDSIVYSDGTVQKSFDTININSVEFDSVITKKITSPNDSIIFEKRLEGDTITVKELFVTGRLHFDIYEVFLYEDPDSTITTSLTTSWIFLGDGESSKLTTSYLEGFSFDGDTLQFDQDANDTRDSIEFRINYGGQNATSNVNKSVYNGIFIKHTGGSYIEYRPTTKVSRTTTSSIYYPGPTCTQSPIWLQDGDKIQVRVKCSASTTTLSTKNFSIYIHEE